MSLKQHLADKKSVITERWIAAVHGTYPFGTIGFLRTQHNPFVNPVGERTRVAAEAFVATLLEPEGAAEAEREKLAGPLDEFMRVRAIQDFSAEEAVGVFFAFKQIISDVLEESPYDSALAGQAVQTKQAEQSGQPGQLGQSGQKRQIDKPGQKHQAGVTGANHDAAAEAEFCAQLLRERLELEANIDALALMAFGSYARHRDLLADLRVKEFKRRHSQVIRRAERTLGEDFSEFK